MTLANPAGLWALLGIPAVLAIHFLQRKARELPVSTLFLLAKTQRESASGRRVDRLMNSVPLWMQLLGVLLLAWILAEPRYQRPQSTQRVAVVLDSSASMGVFREALAKGLKEQLPSLRGAAATLELTLLDSTPGNDRLYHGTSVDEAIAALDSWTPAGGVLSPEPVLRIARSLVGREGAVVYATDTPVESLPYDASLLAIGSPQENVGFTGVRFSREQGADVWHALVRNHGTAPAQRTWQVVYPDGASSEPKPLDLEPGAVVSLQAALPGDRDRAVVRLSADAFTMDDVLPLVRPRPKTVRLFTATSPEFAELADRMVRSLEAIEPVDDLSQADLSITSYDPLDPALPDGNAIVFVNDDTRAGAYLKGGIVAEEHPLVADLNWQSLLVRETIQLDRQPSDNVLLWQDERPLIFVHETARENAPPGRQLCFNFDLRLSNAATQPAFIVCLHRFVESLRDQRVAPSSANLETGQAISLAASTDTPANLETTDLLAGETTTCPLSVSSRLRIEAPAQPGYLVVRQGETDLLTAGLHFADSREADLTACATAGDLSNSASQAVERHTTEDHWWRAWVLLLIAVVLVSWHFSKRGVRDAEPSLAPPSTAL
ncbi:BatA domain-containing protein [Haloferula sargassicola]|uniref:Aerotolerance regulator N-terminal domain-containing protein n=1 Tax=Haloferula sargassicola TaxID=490096 RepID=A0ABP9UPJ2_9BACT